MNNPFAGANLNNIKEMNFSAVLKKIFEEKGISRVELAASTEMSCAFVTKALSNLTLNNIVLESKNSKSERGRPKISLSFNYHRYSMVGLRINARYISSALCLSDGEMLCYYSVDLTDEYSADEVFEICCDLVKKALRHKGESKVLGIGIAAPGPLPIELDRITAPGFDRIVGFSDFPIKDKLREEFSLPVILLHDAHCGALNEFVFGEGDEKYRNIVFIATNTGVGAGIIVDGKPYNGSAGLAGEISNMIIGIDGNFIKLGDVLLNQHLFCECGCESFEDVVLRINAGDEDCILKIDKFLRYLAVACCNFVTTVSPQAIVISDKIAMLTDRVEQVCKTMFDELLPDVYRNSFKLIVRPHIKHSVLRGACGAVLHSALEEPCKYFL